MFPHIHHGIIVSAVAAPVQVFVHLHIVHDRSRIRLNSESASQGIGTGGRFPVSLTDFVNAVAAHIGIRRKYLFPGRSRLTVVHRFGAAAPCILNKQQLSGGIILLIFVQKPLPCIAQFSPDSMASRLLKAVILAADFLTSGQQDSLDAGSAGFFEVKPLTADILKAQQHGSFDVLCSCFFEVKGLSVDILPAGQHRSLHPFFTRAFKEKSIFADVLKTGQHHAFHTSCAGLFEIIRILADVLETGQHGSFYSDLTRFFQIISLPFIFLPADLHSPFFTGASLRRKEICPAADILDTGQRHSFDTFFPGLFEIIPLAVDILPTGQHGSFEPGIPGTFEKEGFAVDILPAGFHLAPHTDVAALLKVIGAAADILHAGQRGSFEAKGACFLKVKGSALDILPAKCHSAHLAWFSVRLEIERASPNQQPVCLQIAVAVEVKGLSVDILPAGDGTDLSPFISCAVLNASFQLVPSCCQGCRRGAGFLFRRCWYIFPFCFLLICRLRTDILRLFGGFRLVHVIRPGCILPSFGKISLFLSVFHRRLLLDDRLCRIFLFLRRLNAGGHHKTQRQTSQKQFYLPGCHILPSFGI